MNQSSMNQSSIDESRTVKILTLGTRVDLSAAEVRRDALDTLENGGVVFLPESGFALTTTEREMIANPQALLAGFREPEVPNGRPTIVFDPRRGKIKHHFNSVHGKMARAQVRRACLPQLEAMMARFCTWVDGMVTTLFPSYRAVLVPDRVTYRPYPRDRRQSLHIDSSYGYPTQGRGMLRLFCNIDPKNRPRVWQVGEPFEPFVRRFIPSVQLRRPHWSASLLDRLGIVRGSKTMYDQMIADIRRLAKRDKEYQRTAPREILEFPSGSCWFAITDLVPHGAISGQHSLDQTFFLPAAGMRNPNHSSLRILERLSGRSLA
jgi:3-deoxy-D-manno-octulosonic acid hydroxylase-like protein